MKMFAPPGVTESLGSSGAAYVPDADGNAEVLADDVLGLLSAGWLPTGTPALIQPNITAADSGGGFAGATPITGQFCLVEQVPQDGDMVKLAGTSNWCFIINKGNQQLLVWLDAVNNITQNNGVTAVYVRTNGTWAFFGSL